MKLWYQNVLLVFGLVFFVSGMRLEAFNPNDGNYNKLIEQARKNVDSAIENLKNAKDNLKMQRGGSQTSDNMQKRLRKIVKDCEAIYQKASEQYNKLSKIDDINLDE